jgi:LysM repeat protein
MNVPRAAPPKKRDKPKARPPSAILTEDPNLRYFEEAIRSHGQRRPPPKKAVKPPKPNRYAKEIGIACFALICLALVVLIGILLTRDNALAVYLNDTRIGYLPKTRETREWDAAYVQTQAINHRAWSTGAEIRVNETVSLLSVRVNRRYLSNTTITELISRVSGALSYQIVATAIYVDGERIALLRAHSLAEYVERHFVGAYETQATVESSIDGWELRTLIVDDGAFDTPRDAISHLDKQVETVLPYVVRPGDMKGPIAARHGIHLNQLLDDNNLTFDAIIMPGQVLNIRTTRPFLMVRTVDRETRTETIPMEVIVNRNGELAVGTVNVLTEGRDGERRLIAETTFENGVLVRETIVSDTVIIEPLVRTEEIGTSETIAPQWRP